MNADPSVDSSWNRSTYRNAHSRSGHLQRPACRNPLSTVSSTKLRRSLYRKVYDDDVPTGVVLAIITLLERGADESMGINVVSIQSSGMTVYTSNLRSSSPIHEAREEGNRSGRRFPYTRQNVREAVAYLVRLLLSFHCIIYSRK